MGLWWFLPEDETREEEEEQINLDLQSKPDVWLSFKLRFNFNFTCTAVYSQFRITKIFIYTLYIYIDMGKIEFWGAILSVQWYPAIAAESPPKDKPYELSFYVNPRRFSNSETVPYATGRTRR